MSVPHGVQTPSESKPLRRFTRHRIETLVYADLGPENGGFPINISEDGMAFQGIRPLERNQTFTITFKLPGISQSMTGKVEIVWLNDTQKGGGLRFVDVPEDSRRLMDGWLYFRRQSVQSDKNPRVVASGVETKKLQPLPAMQPGSIRNDSLARDTVTSVKPPKFLSSPNIAEQDFAPNIAPEAVAEVSDSVASRQLFSYEGTIQRSQIPNVSARAQKKSELIVSFAMGIVFAAAVMIVCGAILWQFRRTLLSSLAGDYPSPPAIQSAQPSTSTLPPDRSAVTDPSLAATKFSSHDQSPTPKDPHSLPAQALTTETSSDPGHHVDHPPQRKPETVQATSIVPTLAVADGRPRIPASVAAPLDPLVTPVRNSSSERISTAVNELPVPEAMQAPSVVPADKPSELSVSATGSTEIILDAYPSIRVPPEPAGRTSQPGSSLTIGHLVSRAEPLYPKDALRQRMAGTVRLHVVIDRQGKVQRADVVDGPALLAEAAVDAVKQWRYEPTVLGGVPIEVEHDVTMVFRITSPVDARN